MACVVFGLLSLEFHLLMLFNVEIESNLFRQCPLLIVKLLLHGELLRLAKNATASSVLFIVFMII